MGFIFHKKKNPLVLGFICIVLSTSLFHFFPTVVICFVVQKSKSCLILSCFFSIFFLSQREAGLFPYLVKEFYLKLDILKALIFLSYE